MLSVHGLLASTESTSPATVLGPEPEQVFARRPGLQSMHGLLASAESTPCDRAAALNLGRSLHDALLGYVMHNKEILTVSCVSCPLAVTGVDILVQG